MYKAPPQCGWRVSTAQGLWLGHDPPCKPGHLGSPSVSPSPPPDPSRRASAAPRKARDVALNQSVLVQVWCSKPSCSRIRLSLLRKSAALRGVISAGRLSARPASSIDPADQLSAGARIHAVCWMRCSLLLVALRGVMYEGRLSARPVSIPRPPTSRPTYRP